MPTYIPFFGRGVHRPKCVLFIVFYLRPALIVGGLLGARCRGFVPTFGIMIWFIFGVVTLPEACRRWRRSLAAAR